MSVTIGGVEYPSQSAVDRALGVPQATVSAAVKRGTLDYLGRGVRAPCPGKVTVVRGVEYPTIGAAAEALGVSRAALHNAIKSGAADTWEPQRPVPVTIRGVEYPSMKKAAAALGVTHQAVSQAKAAGSLDRVGLSRRASE